MEEVKHEETQLNADKHTFLQQHKKLKQEHELVKRELEGHRKNADTLNRLHAQGIIDKQGQPMNSKKREQLQD